MICRDDWWLRNSPPGCLCLPAFRAVDRSWNSPPPLFQCTRIGNGQMAMNDAFQAPPAVVKWFLYDSWECVGKYCDIVSIVSVSRSRDVSVHRRIMSLDLVLVHAHYVPSCPGSKVHVQGGCDIHEG